MLQPSLHQLLGLERPLRAGGPGDGLEVYDFFAGAGGFSQGAVQAGCRVVCALDNDLAALQTHARNHPHTEHRCVELPLRADALPFPTDGRRFHAHFSPPCQKFSTQNAKGRRVGDRAGAEDLVVWSVDTALASRASSWSLEQVPSKHVIALLERAKRRHPGRIAYACLDLSELGVPQTRKRLLAGPPALIAHVLRQAARTKRRSIRDAIAKPRGTHIRNSKSWKGERRDARGKRVYIKAGWGDHCFPIDGLAPTILTRGINWITKPGSYDHRPRLRAFEHAALQTFPPTYKWPEQRALAQAHIGNAVPPLVAEVLMRGARALAPGSPSLRRPPPTLRWPD